jgi:predicted ArsR family transcriptional regulator
VFLVDVLRETLLFARSQAKPVTADDVAAGLGIHRNVARGRLERLARDGLLTSRYARRTGRSGPGAGRPAKVYVVPPETEVHEFPERHYDRLFARLIEEVPAEALPPVGEEYAEELVPASSKPPARTLRGAAERACRDLGRMGFQAAVTDANDTRVTITTATCPLRPLVLANPDAADIDRGLWAGLLKARLEGSCRVSCDTHDCLDRDESCRVVLDFETTDRRST